MAYISASGAQKAPPGKKKPNPVEDMYKVYGSAVKQQAGDYDDIMSRYKGIADSAAGNGGGPGGFTPYNPTLAAYERSPDTTAALSNLHGLTQTGGLSADDQQNLRARGTSPIRAMYATADRDMNRQRSLSGGYSPNFGAVTSRMARDQSSLISDATQNVNAGIAEMVQRGKLSAAPQYAGAAQAESELKNSFGLRNADAQNDAARFNASGMFDAARQGRSDRLGATSGMANLYGTTPALVNTFGNQAMDTARFQNDINVNKKKMVLGATGSKGRY